MSRIRNFSLPVVALLASLFIPTNLFAQTLPTGIAGVVKDSSGAVMPGVTVEASSDVLIEKVRTAVSDERGEYKITDLRPGTYVVTFTLVGFSTIRREDIELVTGFTAKVDADMRVGSLEETLTVSGQSPVVDVQNASQTKVVSNEMLFALPLTKEMGGLAKVTVGVMIPPTAQDVGGNIDPMNAYPVIHGGKTGDNRALLDGMQFNGEGQGRGFYFNPAAAQEASVQLGGQTAEFENGGFQANMVPKDGGNRFTGLFSANYANDNMVADNLTQELQDRGLRLVNTTKRTYDANGAVGGPIFRDRLWFFGSHRVFGYQNYLAGNWSNLTQNTPFYTPDLSRPAIHQQDNVSDGIRFTYQLSRKDKISAAWDIQHSDICLGCSPLVAPEATYLTKYADPNYLLQFKWSRVMSNRFYFEAADSTLIFNWPNRRKPEAQGISILNGNTGFRYNAPLASSLGQRVASQSNQRASLSYVTGSHAFKVGFTTQEAWHHAWYDDGGPQPRARRGHRVLYLPEQSAVADHAVRRAGDVRRTPEGQPRHLRPGSVDAAQADAQPGAALRLLQRLRSRAEPRRRPVRAGAQLRQGRMRAVLAGHQPADGGGLRRVRQRQVGTQGERRAIRGGRHLHAGARQQPGHPGGAERHADLDRQQRQLRARLRSGEPERAKPVGERRRRLRRAQQRQLREEQSQCDDLPPDTLTGFGARSHNWQTQITFDQQLRHNISLGVGYFRTACERLLRHPEHGGQPGAGRLQRRTASRRRPTRRLPGGGGYQICDLYDVVQAKFGQTTNVVSRAPTENGNQSEVYNGFDVVLNIRLARRVNINGGLNTGRTVTNNCGLTLTNLQFGSASTPHTEDYCEVVPPWSASTQVKFSGAFPLPWEFQVATTYQNLPGITYGANATFTNAQVSPSLGRDLSAGPNGTVTIPLIAPSTLYEDRIQQIDFRFSRMFRISEHAHRAAVRHLQRVQRQPDSRGQQYVLARRGGRRRRFWPAACSSSGCR